MILTYPHIHSGLTKRGLLTLTLCYTLSFPALSAPHQHISQDSFESIDLDITGLIVGDEQIFLMPRKKPWFITTPYQSQHNKREKRFGDLLDSKRRTVPEEFIGIEIITHWRGELLFLNPKTLTIHALDNEYKFLSTGSIAWDTLRPAPDSGGEATEHEALQLKKSFRKAVKSSKRERIAGIWPIESVDDEENTHPKFMLATRIQGFPFILMECDAFVTTRCHFTRKCETDFKGSQANWNGLGFKAPHTWYVFDKKSQEILTFKQESCFDIPQQDTFSIPPGYKDMQHMTTDKNGGLWFSSSERDPYTNSTIFHWPSIENMDRNDAEK